MYFEIYRQGKVIKRGNDILNDIDFSNEPMSTPEVSLELPIYYLEYIAGRERFKLFVNNKCFRGIIKGVDVDKNNEKITISISHIIDEWNNRQVSINNAVSDQNINVVLIPKRSQTSDMTIRRDLKNNQQLVGYKLRIKYSQFKGKTVNDVEEWIKEYQREHKFVQAFDMNPPYNELAKPTFVSSTIKYVKYKTKKGGHIQVGTYTATFKTEQGSKITIPVSISYSVKKSGSREPVEVDTTPEVEDEIENILNDSNFAYYDWKINIEKDAREEKISYVYSRQSKYEALTKTIELTDDLFWRVNFEDNKTVDIGRFGVHQPYAITNRGNGENEQFHITDTVDVFDRSGNEDLTDIIHYDTDMLREGDILAVYSDETHSGDKTYYKYTNSAYKRFIPRFAISIVEEPVIQYDFDNVSNVATVLSEKSDSGASCLTLRDLYNMQQGNKTGMKLRNKFPALWEELKSLIYENSDLTKPKFPIVIIRDARYTKVNDERNYGYADSDNMLTSDIDMFIKQSPSVAPNTSLEYAIIDYDGVAMEGGEIIETTYNFNDMSPITDTGIYNEDGVLERKNTKKLSNKNRIKAELVVFRRAIKLLKQSRRNYSAEVKVSELPSDIKVGDKIRFIYTNKIWNLDNCSNYWKKIIQKDDWYYLTKIEYNIDNIGNEVDTITISKQLKIERETENNGY